MRIEWRVSDPAAATVTVGSHDELLRPAVVLGDTAWAAAEPQGDVLAQVGAHGRPRPARYTPGGVLAWAEPQRRVAPGQSVVLYDGDVVLGGGIARP